MSDAEAIGTGMETESVSLFFKKLFAADFIPHGHCYFWRPDIVWLHSISDLLIGLAYYSIPLSLVYFTRKRKDVPFNGLFFLFAAFIFWCGTTHFLNILTLWIPVYRLDGVAKAITACISVYTAIILVPMIPRALALRSPKELADANLALEREIADREKAEKELKHAHDTLETRIQDRTEELARTNQELFRSNTDLQQFAYLASHDLQEPLRTIAVYLQLLEQESAIELNTEAKEHLHFAMEGSQRMSALIDGLLTFYRVGTRELEMKPMASQSALEIAIGNLQSLIRETGAVITHSPLPGITANETQMIQLFQNLIGNALKFRRKEIPQIRVEAKRAEERSWHFSVSDNGIGIDPRHIGNIFAIFKRLHPRDKYPGTGIGLAVCKKIVERHGGKIWMESTLGQGSTLHFTIRERY